MNKLFLVENLINFGRNRRFSVIKFFPLKFKFSASLNYFEPENIFAEIQFNFRIMNKLVLNNSLMLRNVGNIGSRHVSSSTASITKVHRAIYARNYP